MRKLYSYLLTFFVVIVALSATTRTLAEAGLVKVEVDPETGTTTQLLSYEETKTTESGDDKNSEWVLVKDGKVPPGSHVRLDMSTGEKWLKVEKKTGEADSATLQQHAAEDKIVDVLASLPEPDKEAKKLKEKRSEMSPEAYRAAAKRLWDARQKELKRAMETIVDPAKEMKEGMRALDEGEPSEELIISNLLRLEEFVEDIDNAGDFVKMGGFETILKHLGDDTRGNVRSAAAYALGSAVKHNDAFKVEAAKRHFKVISENLAARSLRVTPEYYKECRKMLYAVSAMMSRNDAAQSAAPKDAYHDFSSALDAIFRSTIHDDAASPIISRVASIISDTYSHRVDICTGKAGNSLLSESAERDGHSIGILNLDEEIGATGTLETRENVANRCRSTHLSDAIFNDGLPCKAYGYAQLWELPIGSPQSLIRLRSLLSMYDNYYAWQRAAGSEVGCALEEEGLARIEDALGAVRMMDDASDPESLAFEVLDMGRRFVKARTEALNSNSAS